MGIIKQAKNINISVTDHYKVIAGSITDISEKINIEAKKENLGISSMKKVNYKGEEGVKLDNYSPPELVIEESEIKLESRFALEQLFAFAKKDSKAMFCFWMTDIFGGDIPLSAYEKLYEMASDNDESLYPEITVALDVPGKGATYYSGDHPRNQKFKNHIIVSEGFIHNALEYNNDQKLLMIALVEEFGHHIDYLLRFEFSKTKGDAPGDEGAKYTGKMNRAYKRYVIDPFKNKEQHYATATIDGAEKRLVWDFSDLNQKLEEAVDYRTEKDDSYYAGFEFFGAGMGDDLHGLGHQAIEKNAFSKIPGYGGDKNVRRDQIYFGNWLWDFSQFVDPMVVRPIANALDMLSDEYKQKNVNETENNNSIDDLMTLLDENRVTKNDKRTYNLPVGIDFRLKIWESEIKWESTSFSPVKLSRETITTLVEFIGLKEFGELDKKAVDKEGRPPNYMKYIEDFRKEYAPITTELLGVYRPEEHIDNPAALHPKLIREKIEKDNREKGQNKPFPPADFNHKLDPDFVKDPNDSQWEVSREFGTKKYIRGNGAEPFPSAFSCFIEYIDKSDPNTVEGRMNFGAALHILEDYYAHSNFCELIVMKTYDPEVFPWDNLPASCVKGNLKDHKADIGSNSHGNHSIIDRSKIRFKTLTNPELHPESVKRYLKDNNSVYPTNYYKNLNLEETYQNRGLYYGHAECAAVQTGSFGLLDTIASIAPKLNNKIFSIQIEDEKNKKPGERSLNDAFIYEMLKDISKVQASDTKENNPNYKGTDDNTYSDIYLSYLKYRDVMLTPPFSLVKDFFGFFSFITDYLKVIQNVRNHFLTLTAINLIDDYQTYLDNELTLLEQGNWKVNSYGPTHTQLAKDNGLQPLHHLAVELATSAVELVGKLFATDRDWKRKIKEIASRDLFVHPMYTDQFDQQVIHWCYQNKGKVLLAREASVVLYGLKHGFQEIAELSHQITVINDFNPDAGEQQKFKSAMAGIPGRWHRDWDRFKALWEKQGLTDLKLKSAEETYNEALRHAGYHADEPRPREFGHPIK